MNNIINIDIEIVLIFLMILVGGVIGIININESLGFIFGVGISLAIITFFMMLISFLEVKNI